MNAMLQQPRLSRFVRSFTLMVALVPYLTLTATQAQVIEPIPATYTGARDQNSDTHRVYTDCSGHFISEQEHWDMLEHEAFMSDLYSQVFQHPYDRCHEGPLLLDCDIPMTWVTLPEEPDDPLFPEEDVLIPIVGDITGTCLRASGDESFTFDVYGAFPYEFEPGDLPPELADANASMTHTFGYLYGNGPGCMVIATAMSVDADGGRRVMLVPHTIVTDEDTVEWMEQYRVIIEGWLGSRASVYVPCPEVEGDPIYEACVRKADRQFHRDLDSCARAFKTCVLATGVVGAGGSALICLMKGGALTWAGWVLCVGIGLVTWYAATVVCHLLWNDCTADARADFWGHRTDCCEEACARLGVCSAAPWQFPRGNRLVA